MERRDPVVLAVVAVGTLVKVHDRGQPTAGPADADHVGA
jgi:hypothetical protein